MPQNRQLAAILFTDIVGYTALMQEHEQKAVALIKHYNDALNKLVALHDGHVLNYYGDGSLCSFQSVIEAINCAIDLQKELREEPVVPLRIGLHIGEVFFEEGKALGDGVNIASRIQSLGQANTILFSKEIADKIKNHPELSCVSLGLFEFKNVNEAIEVFALSNEGLNIPKKEQMEGKLKMGASKNKIAARRKWIAASVVCLLIISAFFIYRKFSPSSPTVGKEKTIAVLPFKNISVNKEENEPFCVGVALELQKKLEWMGGLITIAPQSVEKFRDTKLSIADIAGELGGIRYILQGTVQRDKNKVKVFASLVDVESGKELWNDNYPGEMEDIFSLQENIAQQIASALHVKITPEEKNLIERVPSKNPKAVDLYNEAQMSYIKYAYAINPVNSEYQKIQTLCNQTLALDSSMAEIYVLKARAYWIANYYKEYLSKNFMDSVAFFCNKALAIDKNAVDAYVLLSNYYGQTGNEALAYEELNKAIIINPNNFFANWQLGAAYAYSTYYDPEKSIRYLRKALKIDPQSVWTTMVYNNLAFTYLSICDFEKAEYYANRVLELEQNTNAASAAYWCLVVCNNRLGNADKAIELCEKWSKIDSSNAFYHMAEAYCYLKNDCSKALALYERHYKIGTNASNNNVHRWAIALWKIGKKEEALKLMKESIDRYKKIDSLGRFKFATYDMAGVFAFMGDKKAAYKILNEAEKTEHWAWGMPYLIKIDPLFDNLRNDKEFKDLVQDALDEKTKLRDKIRKMEERGEL